MISSIASISSSSSSSSATVRVEKATSEFLMGPDWTMNIDICDAVNTNQILAKDVVKAVKKRLQHKNPKVQLLALTLLETMVKNCGDFVHFQIAEKNILQEMVKTVKKRTDMHVRDKILMLIGSWYDAFGGPQGRYPQYYMAYEDLRRSGVEFPKRSPDAAPIFTPPVTHPTSRQPQPGYGMPSSSGTRLDEAMAAEGSLSFSNINSMRDVLDLLNDMLQAVDPSDRMAVKDEVILDLVEQCRTNQKKLMEMLATTGDEELLGQGLELNDNLQSILAKHDAIASGSPLPRQLTYAKDEASEKHESHLKPIEVSASNATSNAEPSAPFVPAQKAPVVPAQTAPVVPAQTAPVVPTQRPLIDEDEEEEDDFALLARRHTKTVGSGVPPSEAPSSPVMSNALVPVTVPEPVKTKDQDIIELLSLALSTTTPSEQTSQVPNQGTAFTSEAHPTVQSVPFNGYVAPWAQPQPQAPTESQYSQPQSQYVTRPTVHPPRLQSQQPQFSAYPPPPWATTPGYYSNPNPRPQTYSMARPTSSPMPGGMQQQIDLLNGATQANSSPRAQAPTPNAGQKPFIPSYRLFEDINVFGDTDGRFKATSHALPSLSGSTSQSMGGRRI